MASKYIPGSHMCSVISRGAPPPEAVAERDRALSEVRSPQSVFLGEPPRSRSALGKRLSEAARAAEKPNFQVGGGKVGGCPRQVGITLADRVTFL